MRKAEAVVRRLVTLLLFVALRGFIRIGLAERILGVDTRNHIPGDDPGQHEDDDGNVEDCERRSDPAKAVPHQRPETPPTPEHRREVAADQEEQGHPPQMDVLEQAEEQLPAGVIGVVVRHEGDRGVQDDPEEHGDAAECVEVVSTIGRVAQIDGLGVG